MAGLIQAYGAELFLTVCALALLLRSAWKGVAAFGEAGLAAATALAGAGYILSQTIGTGTPFIFLMKEFVLIVGAISVLCCSGFLRRKNMARSEYFVFVLLAVVGLLMMMGAHDGLTFFVSFILQSLCFYILVAFHRHDSASVAAGVKYIVWGGIASAVLLYGLSMLYGVSGDLVYKPVPTGSMMGLLAMAFVVAALGFKISAAPFHMWTPDIYEGAPSSVTLLLATMAKVAAVVVLIRFSMDVFKPYGDHLQQMLLVLAVVSMGVGALGGLAQTTLKSLLAYSAIGNVGFLLMGVALGSAEGVSAALFYLALYVLSTWGAFQIICGIYSKSRSMIAIEDWAGLSKVKPYVALAMLFFLISLAGVPPFAGFWGKFYVLSAVIKEGYGLLAVFAVLTSVISAAYYLRVVGAIYFGSARWDSDVSCDKAAEIGVLGAAIAVLFLSFYPVPLITVAQKAASGF